jgi:hypothetical protein
MENGKLVLHKGILPSIDDDVVRLQVSMDDVAAMQMTHRTRNLHQRRRLTAHTNITQDCPVK